MDPLSPNNINAGWASSPPETPTSAIPSSSSTLSFRDPKIFGAPQPGLVNPPPASASNLSQSSNGQAAASTSGSQGQGSRGDVAPFLRVRIGGLERNRKDLLIRFDASTNLPGFRTTLYKNMQRSYVEFQRFAEQAQMTSPHTIIPALPLPTTSAVTDEEDDRLVRIALQKWFTRICEDTALHRDDELRLFIESDFGYNPAPPPQLKRPTSATSAATGVFSAALSKVVKRGPLDEDEELSGAKGALEKLETNWGTAAATVGGLGKARRAHALANQEVGGKLISLSTVESDFSLAAAERKIGRSLEQLASMAGAQAASENAVLSDSLGYQALNARSGKAALQQRVQILEDSQTATKVAINKRRNVERLKGSSSINPGKVDDAISEMDEANALEETLSKRLNAISMHLHDALRTHSRSAHEDVTLALLEHARLSIGYHKHTLKELEVLKPDVTRIGTMGAPAANTTRTTAPLQPQPPMLPNVPQNMGRGYTSPPRANAAIDGSKSMFLPPPGQNIQRPTSADPPPARRDPLGNGPSSSQGAVNGSPRVPQQPYPSGTPVYQGGHPAQHGPPPGQAGMYGGQHGMAQSMVLPGQHGGQGYPGQTGRTQTVGRAGARRLDEKQAAKLLAGGF